MTFQDLMAGPPPTHLPTDPAAADLAGGAEPAAVVRAHPESPTAWAALAQQAHDAGAEDLTVYAYARVGYHRSLDLLRRNGWKGTGPVPWQHEPNRGFLTCLALLARSAAAIGEGTLDAPGEAAEKERGRRARRSGSSAPARPAAARPSCATPRPRRRRTSASPPEAAAAARSRTFPHVTRSYGRLPRRTTRGRRPQA